MKLPFALELAWLGLVTLSTGAGGKLLRTATTPSAAAAHGVIAAATSDVSTDAAITEASARDAIKLLNDAYGNHADSEEYKGYEVDDDERAAQEMVKKTGSSSAGTYGEVLPVGVAIMLRHVGAKPGMRYYDLGSGTGKTVALAWLLGLDATGVELSDVRYRASCKALGELPMQPAVRAPEGRRQGLRFRLENAEKTDFSDADIVFANSVLLTNATLEILAQRARQMKVGAKLVTYRGLPGPGFRTDGKFYVPCSWFPSVPYVVQTVVAPMQAEQKLSFVQLGAASTRTHKDVDIEADSDSDEAETEVGESQSEDEADVASDSEEVVDQDEDAQQDKGTHHDDDDDAQQATGAEEDSEGDSEETVETDAAEEGEEVQEADAQADSAAQDGDGEAMAGATPAQSEEESVEATMVCEK